MVDYDLSFGEYWIPVKDGDERAFALFKRHYSFYKYKDGRRSRYGYRNRFLFVGPGSSIVLLGADCKALFVWRNFIDDSGQTGVNCAVFRNEGDRTSSELILQAEKLARVKWPNETRFYTYIDPAKIASDVIGYCYRRAKWKPLKCWDSEKRRMIYVKTKSGKLIFFKNV